MKKLTDYHFDELVEAATQVIKRDNAGMQPANVPVYRQCELMKLRYINKLRKALEKLADKYSYELNTRHSFMGTNLHGRVDKHIVLEWAMEEEK